MWRALVAIYMSLGLAGLGSLCICSRTPACDQALWIALTSPSSGPSSLDPLCFFHCLTGLMARKHHPGKDPSDGATESTLTRPGTSRISSHLCSTRDRSTPQCRWRATQALGRQYESQGVAERTKPGLVVHKLDPSSIKSSGNRVQVPLCSPDGSCLFCGFATPTLSNFYGLHDKAWQALHAIGQPTVRQRRQCRILRRWAIEPGLLLTALRLSGR